MERSLRGGTYTTRSHFINPRIGRKKRSGARFLGTASRARRPDRGRQVLGGAAGGEVDVEAGQLLVLGGRRVEDRLVVWKLLQDRALLGAVADRDPQWADSAEDVELGDRQGIHPVQPHRVAEADQVHPARPTFAAGRRPVLMALLDD